MVSNIASICHPDEQSLSTSSSPNTSPTISSSLFTMSMSTLGNSNTISVPDTFVRSSSPSSLPSSPSDSSFSDERSPYNYQDDACDEDFHEDNLNSSSSSISVNRKAGRPPISNHNNQSHTSNSTKRVPFSPISPDSKHKFVCRHVGCTYSYSHSSGRSNHYTSFHSKECLSPCSQCDLVKRRSSTKKVYCRHDGPCNKKLSTSNRASHEKNRNMHRECSPTCEVCINLDSKSINSNSNFGNFHQNNSKKKDIRVSLPPIETSSTPVKTPTSTPTTPLTSLALTSFPTLLNINTTAKNGLVTLDHNNVNLSSQKASTAFSQHQQPILFKLQHPKKVEDISSSSPTNSPCLQSLCSLKYAGYPKTSSKKIKEDDYSDSDDTTQSSDIEHSTFNISNNNHKNNCASIINLINAKNSNNHPKYFFNLNFKNNSVPKYEEKNDFDDEYYYGGYDKSFIITTQAKMK